MVYACEHEPSGDRSEHDHNLNRTCLLTSANLPINTYTYLACLHLHPTPTYLYFHLPIDTYTYLPYLHLHRTPTYLPTCTYRSIRTRTYPNYTYTAHLPTYTESAHASINPPVTVPNPNLFVPAYGIYRRT